jgi:hypothetical protein
VTMAGAKAVPKVAKPIGDGVPASHRLAHDMGNVPGDQPDTTSARRRQFPCFGLKIPELPVPMHRQVRPVAASRARYRVAASTAARKRPWRCATWRQTRYRRSNRPRLVTGEGRWRGCRRRSTCNRLIEARDALVHG